MNESIMILLIWTEAHRSETHSLSPQQRSSSHQTLSPSGREDLNTDSIDDFISSALFSAAIHTIDTDLTPAYLKQITEDSGILRMIRHSFSTNLHNLKYVSEVLQKLDKGTLRKSSSSSSLSQDYSTEALRASHTHLKMENAECSVVH